MLTLQTRQWQHWRVFFWGERATSVHIVDTTPATTHIASAHPPPFTVTEQTRQHWHMNGTRPPTPRHHCKRHGAPGSACVWDTRPSMALLTHSRAPPPEGHVEAIRPRGPLKHQDVSYLSPHRGRKTLYSTHPQKNPAKAQSFGGVLYARRGARPPVCNQSFCDDMKLSKRDSAKRNQRI